MSLLPSSLPNAKTNYNSCNTDTDSNNKGSGIGSGFQCKTFVSVIWICPELNEKATPTSWPSSATGSGLGAFATLVIPFGLWDPPRQLQWIILESQQSQCTVLDWVWLQNQEAWRVGVMGHSLFELVPNGSFVTKSRGSGSWRQVLLVSNNNNISIWSLPKVDWRVIYKWW